MIATILMWLGLALAIAYALDAPWRLWSGRPLRFGTLAIELLLPLLFLLEARRDPVRLLTAVIVCAAALHRIVIRRRVAA